MSASSCDPVAAVVHSCLQTIPSLVDMFVLTVAFIIFFTLLGTALFREKDSAAFNVTTFNVTTPGPEDEVRTPDCLDCFDGLLDYLD
jgi:uncharacterized membrane protein YccC|eukprot:616460-Prymnesium_polylepis.1